METPSVSTESQVGKMKFGELLLKHKIITVLELAEVLREQKRLNQTSKRVFKIGELLLFAKILSVEQMYALLLEQRSYREQSPTKI